MLEGWAEKGRDRRDGRDGRKHAEKVDHVVEMRSDGR